MKKKTPQNNPIKKNKPLKNWAFFVGIAFQMTIIIGGAIWLGIFLDQKFAFDFPWCTVGLSLVGVGAAITHVILELKRFLEN